MKKIGLIKEVVGFDGVAFKNGDKNMTVGFILSQVLGMHKGKRADSMKLWILAQKSYSQDILEVDDADFKVIQNVLKEDATFTPIILGQVEQVLDEAKEEDKK